MGFGKPPTPPSVSMPPPAAHPPTLGSSEVALAGSLQKQKAAAAEGLGMDNTVLTSTQGTSTPQTKSTLLG